MFAGGVFLVFFEKPSRESKTWLIARLLAWGEEKMPGNDEFPALEKPSAARSRLEVDASLRAAPLELFEQLCVAIGELARLQHEAKPGSEVRLAVVVDPAQ